MGTGKRGKGGGSQSHPLRVRLCSRQGGRARWPCAGTEQPNVFLCVVGAAQGIELSPHGEELYVVDGWNHRIRRADLVTGTTPATCIAHLPLAPSAVQTLVALCAGVCLHHGALALQPRRRWSSHARA